MRAAHRGASVKGIDVNPQMLAIARRRAVEAGFTDSIDLCEMGVAEMGSEESESYDIVSSGLCFSELSDDELSFALGEVERILKPGGLLLVADEAEPESIPRRVINRLIRFPLALVTYVATQTRTSAVKNLRGRVRGTGLRIRSIRLNRMRSFIELVAEKPAEG